jgi:pimeloyl-ACP methyl ester carboxylesterase
MFKKITTWIIDYVHLAKSFTHSLIFRSPPEHYLGYIDSTKVPVVLVPGINSKWNFLKKIADGISKSGHPLYISKDLGYNRKDITTSAQLVREMIDKHNLHNVIILAHSKGGLIGKQMLLQCNEDHRIIKVIAIASPFLGSNLAQYVPDKALRELAPESAALQDQNTRFAVNKDIVSIYGLYDNHVWPTEHSILQGAENIKVETEGHHQILSNPKTAAIVREKIAEITSQLHIK